MNSFKLKLIAMIFMVIDHIGLFIFPDMIIFRILGRISFPIYAFLLVNTFKYTKEKKEKNLKLLKYAMITQIIFIICRLENDINIFFSMSIAFSIMKINTDNYKKANIVLVIFTIILILMKQYGVIYEMLIILGIYKYKTTKKRIYLISILILPIIFYNNILYSIFTILGLFICKLYNGKYGTTKYKNIFWYFYPIHIIIIYIISIIIK